jgi:hypothetical protein
MAPLFHYRNSWLRETLLVKGQLIVYVFAFPERHPGHILMRIGGLDDADQSENCAQNASHTPLLHFPGINITHRGDIK